MSIIICKMRNLQKKEKNSYIYQNEDIVILMETIFFLA